MNKKFANAMASAQAKAETEPAPEKVTPVAGNWAGHAHRGMGEIVERAKAEAAAANKHLYEDILAGIAPVQIPQVLIEDIVGTDRIASNEDGDDGSSFEALVSNIRSRGLRQPIRVRPIDPDWRPDQAFPKEVGNERFALQSGRRRLAACRKLGIEPHAFISFSSGNDLEDRSEDLRERFFENAARKSLSAVENLYSIGLIYQEQGFKNQAEAAKVLGVNQANVSRGIAVVENFDELGRRLNLTIATRREIDDALKDIRGGVPPHSSGPAEQSSPTSATLPFKKRDIPLGTVKLRQTSKGTHILSLESDGLDNDKIEQIMELLQKA